MLRHILKKLSTALRKPRVDHYQLLLAADGRIIGGTAVARRDVMLILAGDQGNFLLVAAPITVKVHRSGTPEFFLADGDLVHPVTIGCRIPHMHAGDTVTVH